MLSSRGAISRTAGATAAAARPLAVLGGGNGQPGRRGGQTRGILGVSHAIDKRVYRWAKGVLPPISKTENIALGSGTIGETRAMCEN